MQLMYWWNLNSISTGMCDRHNGSDNSTKIWSIVLISKHSSILIKFKYNVYLQNKLKVIWMLHMCFGIFSKRMSYCKKQIIDFARNMPLNIKKLTLNMMNKTIHHDWLFDCWGFFALVLWVRIGQLVHVMVK